MQRLIFIFAALIMWLSCWMAGGASVNFGIDMLRMPSALGDARLAEHGRTTFTGPKHFNARLERDAHEFTCTAWARFTTATGTFVTTAAWYCPDPVPRVNPDLASNRFGYVTGGVWQTGTVTVAPFPFAAAYAGRRGEIWPRGSYTLAGWTSNALAVSLGGTVSQIPAGPFNLAVIPSAGDALAVSTTGRFALGVSVCPAGQFFNQVDGVRDTSTGLWTGESIITNELSFCVWRFRLTDTEHIYRSDLTRLDRCTMVGQSMTNSLPESGVRVFSRDGFYRVGFQEIGRPTVQTCELFDCRLHMLWLSDEDLCQVFTNGLIEICRRGIPRWE